MIGDAKYSLLAEEWWHFLEAKDIFIQAMVGFFGGFVWLVLFCLFVLI